MYKEMIYEYSPTEEDAHFQIWVTKIGELDEQGIAKWIELELWREENPYAPQGKKRKKKIKTIRYIPVKGEC